jgi:hypothetical protein
MALTVITAYLIALVATLIWATVSSGAAAVPSASPTASAGSSSRVTAPDHSPGGATIPPSARCPSAHKAVRFYAERVAYWRLKMHKWAVLATSLPQHGCPRHLAHVLQRKAHAARLAYHRWHRYQFEWWRWMPDKFQRVGACETGYGKRPGRFDWDSGTYVSFAGIYRPAYEAYHRWTGHNTPREQYEVASAIQARFGWGAWGCGGA